MFLAIYTDDAGIELVLSVEELSAQDPDYHISYERNADSGKVVEHDGIQYYYMENMDRSKIVWLQDGVALYISGYPRFLPLLILQFEGLKMAKMTVK